LDNLITTKYNDAQSKRFDFHDKLKERCSHKVISWSQEADRAEQEISESLELCTTRSLGW